MGPPENHNEPGKSDQIPHRLGRFLTRRWWPGFVFLIIGSALLVSVLVFAPRTEPIPQDPPPGATIGGYWTGLLLVGMFLFAAGISLFISFNEQRQLGHPERREKMIADLTQSLTKALTIIDRIKFDVEEGNALIQRLEQEKEVKSRLAKLSHEDARAVLAQMEEVARETSGRSTRVQVAWNFFFFIAGVLVSYYMSLLIAR